MNYKIIFGWLHNEGALDLLSSLIGDNLWIFRLCLNSQIYLYSRWTVWRVFHLNLFSLFFPIDLDTKNGSRIYKRKDVYFFFRGIIKTFSLSGKRWALYLRKEGNNYSRYIIWKRTQYIWENMLKNLKKLWLWHNTLFDK